MSLTSNDLAARGRRFQQLHQGPGAFVMPNPWDAGTARLMAHSGFSAVATTSAGHAFSIGMPDGTAPLETVVAHVSSIAAATPLPVSADLEDGYAATLDGLRSVVVAVAEGGAVGASIEDRRRSGELYPLEVATERVSAAVAAARSLPFPFMVTARCECFLAGRPDLDETIRRLRAYERAGADVLYAPGLTTREQISAVVGSIQRPLNVLAGLADGFASIAELEDLGVRRISLGSSLSRAALGAVQRALDELTEQGTFGFTVDASPYAALNRAMTR